METSGSGSDQLAVVLRFVDVATDALAAAREEIDALNVYPVPDGDTGTNMYLTFSAARDALRAAAGEDGTDLATALATFGRGALLGARGNSGVILSEMLGALARRLVRDPVAPTATTIAEALQEASRASYAAVGVPVEGTMLTVARLASEAAVDRAQQPGAEASDVFAAAARAAREALMHTPEQLDVLRAAGVVDAGGRGITVILDAAETVLTGRRPPSAGHVLGRHTIPIPAAVAPPAGGTPGEAHATGGGDLTADGPAYEVMYLLDAEESAIADLRKALAAIGDSVVVVGQDGLWNVHVHVDDVGAAIEAGIAAGRPHRVRVTHFAEQVAEARSRVGSVRGGRRVVAVAAGPGLARLFSDAGALVVAGGPGRRPSTGQLLEAITTCGAGEVVVLPNDSDSVRVAQIAARTAEQDAGVRVAVVPTQAQVQGLAALAVHEPGRHFEGDVLEMTATASHTRHGAVTIAATEAITMAGPCRPGDVLGVVAGDFAVVGDDLFTVATDVLERLLAGGGELVTLVSGAAGGSDDEDADALAGRCAAWVEERHPAVDVVVYDGGQERYPLLMSVE